MQHPDEGILWEHHGSVAARDEYDETWEKRKTMSPVPSQNCMDGVGLCRRFVPGPLPPPCSTGEAVGGRQWGYERPLWMRFRWK